MDTYLSSSAGQSTDPIHSVSNWSLSDRFMSNPDCIFVTQMDVRKSRKHIIRQKSPYPNLNLVVKKL